MNDKPIMDKLKEDLNTLRAWEKVYKTAHEQSTKDVKQKEKELKTAKHQKYLQYKKLTETRKKMKKIDTKIKTLPSRLRRWTKNNIGKALNNMEQQTK